MTTENNTLTDKIIALEKGALDKWFKGDTSGYLTIWSQKSFSYFDSFKPERVDTYADIKDFVLANVEGKLFADSYDFVAPPRAGQQRHGNPDLPVVCENYGERHALQLY